MVESDKIKKYLTTLCEQVRWKKVHPILSKEIGDHLIDQTDALMEEGIDKETAVDQAILEMGDPVIVGTQLDSTYRPKMEWSVLVLTAIMLVMGIVTKMIILRGEVPADNSAIAIFIGIVCMFLAYSLDFTMIGKYAVQIFGLLLLLSIIVTYGSPLIHASPYYMGYLLLFFPIALSGIMYKMRGKGYYGLLTCIFCYLLSGLIGVFSGRFSGAVLHSLVCLIMFTYIILKDWFQVKKIYAMMILLASNLIPWACLLLFAPNRLEQLIGGVSGKGGYTNRIIQGVIHNARFTIPSRYLSENYMLPERYTDYFITYLIDRFGFISLILVVLVFSIFLIRLFVLSNKQKSVLGKLISKTIIITFMANIAAYIYTNFGYIIFSTMPLLYLAHGGLGIVVNMTLTGLLLSVFKSGEIIMDDQFIKTEYDDKRVVIADGKITINIGRISKRYRGCN